MKKATTIFAVVCFITSILVSSCGSNYVCPAYTNADDVESVENDRA